MQNHDLTTESGARSARAEFNNFILKKLYETIQPEYVSNPLACLNFVDHSQLRSFINMTTGYLGIQNYENLAENLKDEDIHKIIGGTFKIKELSTQEVREMTPPDVTPKKKGNETRINLTEIQDGRYYILQKNGKNFLMLKTDEVRYYPSNPNAKINSKDLFHIIRNVAAHSVSYYINENSNLIYFTEDGSYIEISRMWLRGYSELFAKQKSILDTQKATEILTKNLAGKEPLKNIQEVNKALSLILPCFEKSVQKNFRTVNNFVNFRLQSQTLFFDLPVENQIEFLVHIININPNYATSSKNETLSPTIIYNLQQLASSSIEISGSSFETGEIIKLEQRKQELITLKNKQNENARYLMQQLDQNKLNPIEYQLLIAENKATEREYNAVVNKLNTLRKLESSEKKFFDPALIVYSPIELSVNLIALMAHNSLAHSAFYDDILNGADFDNLNTHQERLFNTINLDKLAFSYKDKIAQPPLTNDVKCFMLNTIRNAVCHSLVSYQIPNPKQGVPHDFRDVVITFYSDKNDMKVVGTVADFYEILSSEFFTKPRKPEVMSRPVMSAKIGQLSQRDPIKIEKPKKPSSNDDGSDS